MSRINRINESRILRIKWMAEARRTSREVFPIRFADCLRKARFHHANLMAIKLAEWA